MPVKHKFTSIIPDNPADVAAGKVVPTNWNDNHNVNVDLTTEVTGVLPIANGGTGGTGGAGTVNSVSVVTANGVSGSVANPTTTPAITLALGAITPSSVAASGTVTGSNLSGTNTGDQTITLTGDVTGSGTGSFATTLATVNSNVGSFGSASQTVTLTVNGKGLATAASQQNIQIAESQVTNLVFDLAGKQATGNYITALTGDVTASGPGSAAATIAANAVTNAKLATVANNTFKANNSGSTAVPSDIALTNSRQINQNAHGFAVGNILKLSGSATYAKALADSASDGEVIGMVASVIDVNNFVLVTQGYVSGLSGFTANTVYFLDPSSAGAITATPPSTVGQVRKAVFVADTTTSGYFINYIGQIITAPSLNITACGSATMSGGTVTVNTAAATSTCKIEISTISGGTNVGFIKYSVSAGVSFTITSSNALDNSSVSYLIVEP